MIERDAIYCADLGDPSGSRPAKRRPVLVVQSDPYNASRLATVLAAVVTSNTALAAMPGNVFVPAADLTDRVGHLPLSLVQEVDRGLRRVLGL